MVRLIWNLFNTGTVNSFQYFISWFKIDVHGNMKPCDSIGVWGWWESMNDKYLGKINVYTVNLIWNFVLYWNLFHDRVHEVGPD